ncbi:hypothetical protein QVD17_33932 [Tagetes erecta]|uniref:Uncharacterized protein n=1 Tax=Tagetes erecta TaxID=13708 RepID=A0AAD8K009_TARER|nr:hypothetical protein QVD17_33932 [Tagetes erecta]
MFLLFITIKVSMSFELPATGSLLQFQAQGLSASVAISVLCLTFMSTIVCCFASTILLSVSPWDDSLFKVVLALVSWLYESLTSFPMQEIVSIFNTDCEEAHQPEEVVVSTETNNLDDPREEEAHHQQELTTLERENFVVFNVDH